MIAYKLFRKRNDGTYGTLFINRRQRLTTSNIYMAEDHQTKGYAHRPGWHCCEKPQAPHLSKKARVWCAVDITDFTSHIRPAKQGGKWYTANYIQILYEVEGQ